MNLKYDIKIILAGAVFPVFLLLVSAMVNYAVCAAAQPMPPTPDANGILDYDGDFDEISPGVCIEYHYGADSATRSDDGALASNWTISGATADIDENGHAACWEKKNMAQNTCSSGTCGYGTLAGCATGSCWVQKDLNIDNETDMKNRLQSVINDEDGTFNFNPKVTFNYCSGHDFHNVGGNMFIDKNDNVKTESLTYKQIVSYKNITKRHFYLTGKCKTEFNDVGVASDEKHTYHIGLDTDFKISIKQSGIYCHKCYATGSATVTIKGTITKEYACVVNMAKCRDVIYVYLQNTDGTFPENPSDETKGTKHHPWHYCASNTYRKCWKCFTSKKISDIVKDDKKERPGWNRNGDIEYYASGTHLSSEYEYRDYYDDNIPKQDSCCGSTDCSGHLYKRYIYRRSTVDLNDIAIMHSNKQSGASTNINSPYVATGFNNNLVNYISVCTYDANNNASYKYEPYTLTGTWKIYNDNNDNKDFSLSVTGVIIGDKPSDGKSPSILSVTAPSADTIYNQVGYSVDKTFYEGAGSSEQVKVVLEKANEDGTDKICLNNMGFDITSDGKTTVKNLYAHWVSDPARLTAIPNSRFAGRMHEVDTTPIDSAMAAHNASGFSDVYMVKDSNSVKDSDYKTNSVKLGFDTEADLDDITVENVTVKFNKSSTDETVDFSSYTTDVSFKGWKEAELGFYGYNESEKPWSLPQCSLGDSNDCTKVHGEIDGNKYKFNNRGWNLYSDSSAEKPKSKRTTAVVATFEGSWKVVLPNAYKDGYLFKGWYSGDNYIGLAGDIIDLKSYVADYNKNGYTADGTCSKFNEDSIESEKVGYQKFMTGINLTAHFEPLKIKVLYDMNIPKDTDSTTSYGTVQSHTNVDSSDSVNNMHSYAKNGSTSTSKYTFGSTDPKNTHYSYIGSKTYTYDASDWNLEPIGISVNDYDFIGWKYKDVIWPGYGKMSPAGGSGTNKTIIGTIIGGKREDTYNTDTDSLETLKMEKNPVYNESNNAPHTKSAGGSYKNQFKILNSSGNKPTNEEIRNLDGNWLNKQSGKTAKAQTDADIGSSYVYYATGHNDCNTKDECVYIVLEAQWTNSAAKHDIEYNSNNMRDVTKTDKGPSSEGAFSKYTDYVSIKPVSDSLFDPSNGAITLPFGAVINKHSIDSSDTVVGDTSDDGSYDKNATSDSFIVNKANGRYYSGTSNGRTGFFSFQGWSVWKYATWRDAIGSNKKDNPAWSELQPAGEDSNSINTSYTANSFTPRAYNDVERSKRAGDLYYRMASVLYNGGNKTMYNDAGSMLETVETIDTPNPKHPASRVLNIWEDYTKRWVQGSDGTYHIPMQLVTKQNIKLYAIWDAYPMSKILNIYCDKDDINKLTPAYLFSKVTAYDYEDFIYNKNYCIGSTADGDVDWNTVCTASEYMNEDNASECPAGDYAYTYKIKGDKSIMPGEFKATLVGYDYSRFSDVAIIDDIGAVSMTFRFEDSAGNMTFKTAWVYITDNDDDNYNKKPTPSPNPDDPDDPDNPDGNNGGGNKNEADNTRYSTTRFISEDNYNKAEFDDAGNYVYGSARESDGALLLRSKWYMDESYKTEIQDAFANLKAIGDSSLELNFSPINNSLASNSGTGASLFDMIKPSMKAVWTGDYHPQLNEDGKWIYDWDKIAEKTVGIYRLGYEDIVKTKQLVRNQFDLSNSDKFSSDTMGKFLAEFRKCAYKPIEDASDTENTSGEDSH